MNKRTFLRTVATLIGAGTTRLLGQATTPTDTALFNWARNVRYGATRLFQADSTTVLRRFVKQQSSLKVLGSRHCFSRIADSDHQLASLRNMSRVLSLDETRNTVTVEGGMIYGVLGPWLDTKGYALHNLASLPHISVAGACATATHGSGSRNGNLATSVRAFELLLADGSTKHISKDKTPELFSGAAVHLGALGVVTNLTLDIIKSFDIREYNYRQLSLSTVYDHFDEIMASAYSVSLFTNWSECSARLKVREDNSGHPGDNFFGAKPANAKTDDQGRRGTVGPWYERLPHFRMDSLGKQGDELQSEYFVAIDDAVPALKSVAALGAKIRPHLRASEIRTVAADDLWMSMCYGRPSVAIHFTWKNHPQDVAALLPQIEEALSTFNVRPHWGKLFAIPPKVLQSRYPRYHDFQKLASELDPHGKFLNSFLRTNLSL